MSGDNLTYLHATTDQPLPVARVLDAAKGCATVLVLGELADGTAYRAASEPDTQRLLWWIESFKHQLLAGAYDAEGSRWPSP